MVAVVIDPVSVSMKLVVIDPLSMIINPVLENKKL